MPNASACTLLGPIIIFHLQVHSCVSPGTEAAKEQAISQVGEGLSGSADLSSAADMSSCADFFTGADMSSGANLFSGADISSVPDIHVMQICHLVHI